MRVLLAQQRLQYGLLRPFQQQQRTIRVRFEELVVADENILLMQADMHLRSLRKIHGVIPS